MKRNLYYLLSALVVGLSLAACTKTNVVKTPTYVLKGTFTGLFVRLHETMKTGAVDTMKATISLKFDSLGTFSVGGDTTTVHAGSYGTWALGYASDLVFTDKTATTTLTPVKQHLNGDYAYQYNGSNLQMIKLTGDSVSYQYFLTKSSN